MNTNTRYYNIIQTELYSLAICKIISRAGVATQLKYVDCGR